MTALDIRFKDSHHRVAQMFAAGMEPWLIRQQTGYSRRRLNLLYQDRAFQELIASYRERLDPIINDQIDHYVNLKMQNMLMAEEQINQRLEDAFEAGETLPVRELLAISADGADRLGYSKHTMQTIKHDVATGLEKAIARSGKTDVLKALNAKQIDSRPLPSDPGCREEGSSVSPAELSPPPPTFKRRSM